MSRGEARGRRGEALGFLLRALLGAGYAVGIHALLRGDAAGAGVAGRAALLVPAGVCVGLLAAFAATLRPGREPMIARVAQAMEREPIPARLQPWLRQVTKAWCVFFAANTAISLLLALFAPLAWWTLWNGALAYVAVGGLLLGEYLLRKIRYRWYRDGFLDRVWRRILPPRSSDVG